jgi:3',5'-cyclic AMP phosphodiesterase CpdA
MSGTPTTRSPSPPSPGRVRTPCRGDVSRRSLLASIGAGLLGVCAAPSRLPAGGRPVPEFSFIVVSDTHLGRGDAKGPAEQWAKTAREIEAADGDFVLHLGDVVDGGRAAQYAVYKEVRKAIRKPVYEVPGNHDPQELFEKHLRKPVELTFDHKGVRFVLLNNSRPDSHDGFLTPKQLAWLRDQCDDAAKKTLFLVLGMHVPVHENKHPDRGWHVKPKDGQAGLYALLDRHKGRVLALLHGHFHNGVRGWDDHAPLQEVVFPSALYNQDRRLTEQKAPGYYLPELRPGFVEVRLHRAGMRLRYKAAGVPDPSERLCPLPQFTS